MSLRKLLLSTLAWLALEFAEAGDEPKESQRAGRTLGVEHVRLFARAPVNGTDTVVALNLWLKRILPASSSMGQQGSVGPGPSFMLPTQIAALEGFGWAEDLASLNSSKFGHLLTAVDMHTWRPQLLLEAPTDGPLVEATQHPATWALGGAPIDPPWSHMRPFFFRFRLTEAQVAARCFKVLEATHPDYKAIICPPASSTGLCNHLAPPARFTPARPALWVSLSPLRTMGTPGPLWEAHMRMLAARLHHVVSYLRAMGGTGVLLYADRLTAGALEPLVKRLLGAGSLVFVAWEEIERMKYNYDQALVYSHALLGLSGCGENLWLSVTDMDELLYNPYGKAWPEMFRCMVRSAGAASGGAAVAGASGEVGGSHGETDTTLMRPGLFRLARVDVVASAAAAGEEAARWSTLGDAAAEGGSVVAAAAPPHPVDMYDRIAETPFDRREGKYMACPARRIVAVWVHGALPVEGSAHEADPRCAIVLHMTNFWRQRTPLGDLPGFSVLRMRGNRPGAVAPH